MIVCRESLTRPACGGPPSPRGRGLKPHARSAYTLLEMLLTLAVLSIVAGMSWPLLSRAQQDLSLRQAGQDVRRSMISGRVNAIETGSTWQFRYEPGGRRYLVMPLEQTAEADSLLITKTAAELPEGMTFLPADDQPLTTEQLPSETLTGLSIAEGWTAAMWATPVTFASDGTASSAAFRIIDAKSQFIPISVRGLTGSVNVGRVDREVQP